jgi:hypothetical protein
MVPLQRHPGNAGAERPPRLLFPLDSVSIK